MSSTTDIVPVEFKGFNGLWNRGNIEEVPPDHLVDCQNCIFPGKNQIDLREPTTVQTNLPTQVIIAYAIANVSGGAALLTLDSSGTMHDATHGTTLIAAPGANDFSLINIYGRAYVTFLQNGKTMSTSPNLLVYYYSNNISNYVMLVLDSTAPSSTITTAETLSGVVPPGAHYVYCAFQNERGHLSALSSYSVIVSSGAHNILISNIPTGPADTYARVLCISPANQTEPFFIPQGTVLGNSAGSTFNYNHDDSVLTASADYLFDTNPHPYGGTSLSFYHGRLIVVGQYGSPDNVAVSNVTDPEGFDSVTGIVHMPVDYGINTSSGSMVIRDVLYVTKPNGTYSVQDNGDTPDTWQVSIVDSGIGAWAPGISVFQSSMSGQDVMDSCLVANKRGLMLFDGTYGQIPLTYKIDGIWSTLDQNYFYLVRVSHDVWNKRIYIHVPITYNPLGPGGSYSGVSHLGDVLMGDYQEGFQPMAIKWSWWRFINQPTQFKVLNFTLNYANNAMIYQPTYCYNDTIYKIVPPIGPNDIIAGSGNQSIDQLITLGPMPPNYSSINMFQMMAISMSGTGLCTIYVWDKGGKNMITLLGFDPSTYTNQNQLFFRQFLKTNECIYVRLECNGMVGGTNGRIIFNKLMVYFKSMWQTRPSLLQGT